MQPSVDVQFVPTSLTFPSQTQAYSSHSAQHLSGDDTNLCPCNTFVLFSNKKSLLGDTYQWTIGSAFFKFFHLFNRSIFFDAFYRGATFFVSFCHILSDMIDDTINNATIFLVNRATVIVRLVGCVMVTVVHKGLCTFYRIRVRNQLKCSKLQIKLKKTIGSILLPLRSFQCMCRLYRNQWTSISHRATSFLGRSRNISPCIYRSILQVLLRVFRAVKVRDRNSDSEKFVSIYLFTFRTTSLYGCLFG